MYNCLINQYVAYSFNNEIQLAPNLENTRIEISEYCLGHDVLVVWGILSIYIYIYTLPLFP